MAPNPTDEPLLEPDHDQDGRNPLPGLFLSLIVSSSSITGFPEWRSPVVAGQPPALIDQRDTKPLFERTETFGAEIG